jgi:hypothetical protein
LLERACQDAGKYVVLFLNKAYFSYKYRHVCLKNPIFRGFLRSSTCQRPYGRKNQEIRKKGQRTSLHLETLFPTKKNFLYRSTLDRELLDRKSAIFRPCAVNISVKIHDIGLKFLP